MCVCRPSQDQAAKLKTSLEGEVQAFLDIVSFMYEQLPNTVEAVFSAPPPNPVNAQASAASPLTDNQKPSSTIKSMQSFKALTECPIIVVLLFQLYPKFQQVNIKKFLPLIVRALSLQPPPGAHTRHRQACVDLIAAQVKTLSFLAYLLQKFSKSFSSYEERVPQYAIQLLLNCPSESTSIRRV